MKKLQAIRGTKDLLPEEFAKFQAIVQTARDVAASYCYEEMATPIFESTDVFARTMGESSDVVTKEMYTFDTKGGESVTLRPEFTAGIARAFISNGMQQHLPCKLFSTGPLFRYERPQKGRQRQFHQLNFESLGDDSVAADVEIITLAGQLLYFLTGKACELHINTLGDAESRTNYRDALVAYYTPFKDQLSEDSQRRLDVNPMRILDSKDEGDKKINENAPKIYDHLNDFSRDRFDDICDMLENAPIFQHQVIRDPAIVRGLDYYSHTVFEFISNDEAIGAQSTILAGGRYDGLIEQMGGKPTPAIGFAAGLERLMLIAEKNIVHTDDPLVTILPMTEVDDQPLIWIATVLRSQAYLLKKELKTDFNFPVEILRGNPKKLMNKANQRGAKFAIIIGEDEVANNEITIKDLVSGDQTTIANDEPWKYMAERWKKYVKEHTYDI